MPDTLDYEIREQKDLDLLFASVVADFEHTYWSGTFLTQETRRLEKHHDGVFKTRGGSFFTKAGGWAPNAQGTVRKKGHHRPLFGIPSQGFRLHKSLTQPNSEFGVRYEFDEWPRQAQLVFGTDAPYHAFNQYGTRRIPARPHVGVSEQYVHGIAKRAIDHVFANIQGSNDPD